MKNIFKINKNIYHNSKAGFSIIEVLIACIIISMTILAIMSAASKGIELSNRALRQVQASMLMEEGVEAIKSIRDTNWTTISNLDLNTNYYLSFDTNSNIWSLGTIPSINPMTPIDGIFTRMVIFSEVNRDSNDDIALTGTLDIGIKRVNVIILWPSKSETISKNITFYLTNIFN